MSFILDTKWTGKGTFEDIVTWFCLPMREFLIMFDEYYEEDNDDRATFLYYEMRSKVDDLEKLLYRLMNDYRKNPMPDDNFLDGLKEQFKNLKEAGLDPIEVFGNWLKWIKLKKVREGLKGQPPFETIQEEALHSLSASYKDKTKNICNDDRFWDYVAQIRIDEHDPADILEDWLKEHKPDFFEDS